MRWCQRKRVHSILYLCTDDKHNKQALLDKPSIIHKWIVLDGSSSILWADNMNQLLSDVKVLSLANGQKITLKGTNIISIICELTPVQL